MANEELRNQATTSIAPGLREKLPPEGQAALDMVIDSYIAQNTKIARSIDGNGDKKLTMDEYKQWLDKQEDLKGDNANVLVSTQNCDWNNRMIADGIRSSAQLDQDWRDGMKDVGYESDIVQSQTCPIVKEVAAARDAAKKGRD